MLKRTLPFLAIGGALACGDRSPTAPPTPPAFLVAGQSGCHTVSGSIRQVGVFPTFTGTVSGDIVGTVSTQLDPAQQESHGNATFSAGEQTWQVTGGSVLDLIGQNVALALQTEVVFAQPTIGTNNTRARVVAGAKRGHLTYHGALYIVLPPPFVAEVDYHGVVCP
jgi:hypothetical protein